MISLDLCSELFRQSGLITSTSTKSSQNNGSLIAAMLRDIQFFSASLQYLPCYMMRDVDHLSVFLSQFAQNMPHRYFLL